MVSPHPSKGGNTRRLCAPDDQSAGDGWWALSTSQSERCGSALLAAQPATSTHHGRQKPCTALPCVGSQASEGAVVCGGGHEGQGTAPVEHLGPGAQPELWLACFRQACCTCCGAWCMWRLTHHIKWSLPPVRFQYGHVVLMWSSSNSACSIPEPVLPANSPTGGPKVLYVRLHTAVAARGTGTASGLWCLVAASWVIQQRGGSHLSMSK